MLNPIRGSYNYPNVPNYPLTRRFLIERAGQAVRAGWAARFVAFLIDFLLVSVPFNFIGQFTWLRISLGTTGTGDSATTSGFSFQFPNELHNFLWMLALGGYALWTTRKFGATIGKRYMNLKVVQEDGVTPPTDLIFFARHTVGYLLSYIILGIGFIMAVFDPDHEALHDKLFKTAVIWDDPTKVERWF